MECISEVNDILFFLGEGLYVILIVVAIVDELTVLLNVVEHMS